MKKILAFLLVVVGISLVAGAVDNEKDSKFKPIAPDMDTIKHNIENPYSNYYYKKLWRKFLSNDTNMSMQEYRHLYLGYMFQEDYDPYRRSEFSEKIQPLYYKKSHTPAECDTIIKYAELSLADDPFDLRQMEFFIYALKEKKKYARASIWQFRLNHLIPAILSTGKGTKEMPWVVTSPIHEYVIINNMGMMAVEHQPLEGDVDYIIVDKPKDKKAPEGYYFDVSMLLKIRHQKFGD